MAPAAGNAGLQLPGLPHDSTAGITIGVYVPFTSLSLFLVVVRLYTRGVLLRFIGIDDILIIFAWVFSFATFVIALVGIIHDGVGKHFWDLGPNDLLNWLAIELHVIWVHQWALVFTRISILTFYLRVWPTKVFQNICYSLIFLNAAFAILNLAGEVTMCNPVRKWWKPQVPGTCRDFLSFWLWTAVANIFFDVAVYALPFPMLRRLKINKKQKTALYVTFGLGLVALVFSCVRVYFIHSLNLNDPLYSQWGLVVWSSLELNIGIICACIPALKALLRKVFPGSSFSNYYYKASSYARSRTGQSRHSRGLSLQKPWPNKPSSKPFNKFSRGSRHEEYLQESEARAAQQSASRGLGEKGAVSVEGSGALPRPMANMTVPHVCDPRRMSCHMHRIELRPLEPPRLGFDLEAGGGGVDDEPLSPSTYTPSPSSYSPLSARAEQPQNGGLGTTAYFSGTTTTSANGTPAVGEGGTSIASSGSTSIRSARSAQSMPDMPRIGVIPNTSYPAPRTPLPALPPPPPIPPKDWKRLSSNVNVNKNSIQSPPLGVQTHVTAGGSTTSLIPPLLRKKKAKSSRLNLTESGSSSSSRTQSQASSGLGIWMTQEVEIQHAKRRDGSRSRSRSRSRGRISFMLARRQSTSFVLSPTASERGSLIEVEMPVGMPVGINPASKH